MGRIRLQMDEYYSILFDQKRIYLLFGVKEPEVLPCAMDAGIPPWMPPSCGGIRDDQWWQ
jgi:hypothetical protein